jgi:integrase
MVTVRQKKKGRGRPWYIFIHQNRQITSKCIGDKRAAEAIASAIRKRIKAGELNLDGVAREKKPSFGEYVQTYLNEYAAVVLKLNTYRSYIQINKCHLSSLHGIAIDKVSRSDIKRLLLKKYNDGFAPATVGNIRVFVSGVFSHAVDDEIVKVNPAAGLGKLIKRDDHRKHVRALSREQVSVFLQTVRTEFRDDYPLMLTAFRTGLRQGELAALSWSCIDFDSNTVHVRRSFSHNNWSTPKSRRSREVDMSDQLRAVLLDHRDRQIQRFGCVPVTELPKGAMLRMVFADSNGGPKDMDNFRRRAFAKMIEVSGLARFRFHDIRHTFASLLLAQGESLAYVRDQLGHASIQTTVDIYAHLIPGANRNAVNRLDDHDLPPLNIAAS